METKRMIDIYKLIDIDPKQSKTDIELSVLDQDTISREEIREYAMDIAAELNRDDMSYYEKRFVLLDMLSTNRIIARLHWSDSSEKLDAAYIRGIVQEINHEQGERFAEENVLTYEEIHAVLQPIRETLLDEVLRLCPNEDIGMFVESLSGGENIAYAA